MNQQDLKTLDATEISEVSGGAGEISAKYLKLRAENTKSGEIQAQYLKLVSESTK
ncbi:hypothetical protein KIF53_01145 [Chromobacterium subtsugae]|uniref:Bacteriocin n=1 Tax=Chromobacterium subtsugae TaxID=251747 RepID=A0ABS7F8C7_9NEIS|nr:MULTISPECIES: hypothetical protein [Chromobacterium]MBW7565231.1 hypothetical protein [Chromobacterium subtsugae]MBW8286241.1 hypothetical protein [Chromobacterium subtsugae]WSE91707.1 hypothetical protein U6115_00285 [Chromobacterium subtsugae]WVH60082.1 hypothetical protein U6151_00285 [Chromobacterium subtsugae]